MVQRADALLQTVDVVHLHFITEVIYELLERLDPVCTLDVVIHESTDGGPDDLAHSADENIKLFFALAGECNLFVVQLLSTFGDVQRMVGNPLKVVYGVQVFSNRAVLLGIELAAGYMDEVSAELILVFIDDVLKAINTVKALIAVSADKLERAEQIFLGLFCHGVHGKAALLDGKSRVVEEALLEPFKVLKLLAAGGLITDDEAAELFKLRDKGRKQDNYHKAEHGVQKRKAHRRHGHRHEGKADHGIERVEDRAENNDAQSVDQKIRKGGAFAVCARAEGGKQNGDRGADGDAHYNGQGDIEAYGAGYGKRLQNADGGGGALYNAGENKTEQYAEQGI